jgi:hypothetical protein
MLLPYSTAKPGILRMHQLLLAPAGPQLLVVDGEQSDARVPCAGVLYQANGYTVIAFESTTRCSVL